jgi:hypothetical protein
MFAIDSQADYFVQLSDEDRFANLEAMNQVLEILILAGRMRACSHICRIHCFRNVITMNTYKPDKKFGFSYRMIF